MAPPRELLFSPLPLLWRKLWPELLPTLAGLPRAAFARQPPLLDFCSCSQALPSPLLWPL
ncbi:MAG: hypothetical protein EBZ03_08415 [Betaproteobacteria bacterium]|nr:hypothetical protein [Betaproteobacteria bacterium]NCV05601.1 hypothetical protein [Betaproteobacteria bacterium]NCX13016.1 hypothetical protein [Betaproteobacteria bacterium]NCX88516.1 hypothetical protein [Betaproteobacteria bacterium]NCZ99208.1 hypothetical protein [Betaproteobacteria bacterium]